MQFSENSEMLAIMWKTEKMAMEIRVLDVKLKITNGEIINDFDN